MDGDFEDASAQLFDVGKFAGQAGRVAVTPEVHRLDAAQAQLALSSRLVLDREWKKERADASGELGNQRRAQVAQTALEEEVVAAAALVLGMSNAIL